MSITEETGTAVLPETVPETAECARCEAVSGRAAMTFNGADWYCGRLPEATSESDPAAIEAATEMYYAAIAACERRRVEHACEPVSEPVSDDGTGAEAA